MSGDCGQDGAGQFLCYLSSAVALQQGGQSPLSAPQELVHVWGGERGEGAETTWLDHLIYPRVKREEHKGFVII